LERDQEKDTYEWGIRQKQLIADSGVKLEKDELDNWGTL
jgi:hypothetical protein